MKKEIKSPRMSLKECAQDMGYEYDHFLKIYTDIFIKNEVKIISIPGCRKKWIDRDSYERMFQMNAIN